MINTTPYPVLSQTSLDPLQGRLFRGGRRGRLGLLPRQPGTILVFQINDQFVVATPGGGPMTGRIGDATAVALVSLHRQPVTTMAMLPSRWAHTYFSIETEYDCQVVDAALVLQFGCWDVRPYLQRYLTADPKIQALAASADPLDVAAFRLRFGAYAVARNRISPPYVPGMVCDLVHITIEIQHGAPGPEPAIGHPNGGSPNGHTGPAPQDYVWDG